MAKLCIKTLSSAIQVLIFQLLVLRPRPSLQFTKLLIQAATMLEGLGDKRRLAEVINFGL